MLRYNSYIIVIQKNSWFKVYTSEEFWVIFDSSHSKCICMSIKVFQYLSVFEILLIE